jgi:hypothetical protein
VVDHEDAAEGAVAGGPDLIGVDGRAVFAGEDDLGGRERFLGCCHGNSFSYLGGRSLEP